MYQLDLQHRRVTAQLKGGSPKQPRGHGSLRGIGRDRVDQHGTCCLQGT
jgi:hypothetical protein